jgi:hypothetical protein
MILLVSHTRSSKKNYILLFKTSIREKYTKMLLPLSSFKHTGRENKGIQCFFYVSSRMEPVPFLKIY